MPRLRWRRAKFPHLQLGVLQPELHDLSGHVGGKPVRSGRNSTTNFPALPPIGGRDRKAWLNYGEVMSWIDLRSYASRKT
jgi:hypothetical protein